MLAPKNDPLRTRQLASFRKFRFALRVLASFRSGKNLPVLPRGVRWRKQDREMLFKIFNRVAFVYYLDCKDLGIEKYANWLLARYRRVPLNQAPSLEGLGHQYLVQFIWALSCWENFQRKKSWMLFWDPKDRPQFERILKLNMRVRWQECLQNGLGKEAQAALKWCGISDQEWQELIS